MRRSVAICSLLFALCAANESFAGRPGWIFPVQGQHGHRTSLFHGHGQRKAPSYQETYHRLNAAYPKYIGAFHANYFRDLGVAPGDVGIRGNSLYPFPW